ncbi:MAG: hypothetical protein U0835_24510 [Isosphaeraceae bacterium]
MTRDTWVSEVGREADGNNGGSSRLKLKSYQEMSLVDVDASPLRGRVVIKAMLHVKVAGNERLHRVTVGSLSVPWVEGRSNSYGIETGASTFRSSRHGEAAWTPDGGDLCRVILGQGGSAWGMAEATPTDPQGWQTIAVDPKVVALRGAGLSDGFVLFDDTGTEWTRDGEKFTLRHMPNRYVYSRDQNAASAPYFTVELGSEDRTPPAVPAKLTADATDLPPGELRLTWPTPADRGPAGVAGFLVEVDGRPVLRSLVLLAGRSGRK